MSYVTWDTPPHFLFLFDISLAVGKLQLPYEPHQFKERQESVTLPAAFDCESTECIPSPHNPIIILPASAPTCFPKSNPRYHSSDHPKGKVESSFLSFKNGLEIMNQNKTKTVAFPSTLVLCCCPYQKAWLGDIRQHQLPPAGAPQCSSSLLPPSTWPEGRTVSSLSPF